VLLVLFVLLTLAAVVVGVYVLRTVVLAAPDTPSPAGAGSPPGTVVARGVAVAGPAGASAVNGSTVVVHAAALVGGAR
jgi:hypothetical protein